jgi:2-keto-4-pentenoate hydratase
VTFVALDDPRLVRGYEAQFAKRRAAIADGARAIGWKVGFGAPVVMEQLKLAAPLVGFLIDPRLVRSGAPVSLAGWTKPAAEPELAVHIGRDFPRSANENMARDAIAGVSPAIELADVDAAPENFEQTLAGNIFHRHVVLGNTRRSGASLEGLTAHVLRNKREVAVTSKLEDNTGSIVGIVQHVAKVLAHFGETLRAGDIIIAGSIVPPFFLDEGDGEFAMKLVPVGEASVRFSWR